MGSRNGSDDERPEHGVWITKGFLIQTTEVTQAQWIKVMERNPSEFKGDDLPVDNVSWNDVQEFLQKLNARREGLYRLPSEAEWEYACRADSQTTYFWGDDMDGKYAWYRDNSMEKSNPVAMKKSNKWSLYDMSGNVSEWCADWYDKDYYRNSVVNDPRPFRKGTKRIIRGGSWQSPPVSCPSAKRDGLSPDTSRKYVGFRVVLETVSQAE